jgi:hypothetical protein
VVVDVPDAGVPRLVAPVGGQEEADALVDRREVGTEERRGLLSVGSSGLTRGGEVPNGAVLGGAVAVLAIEYSRAPGELAPTDFVDAWQA